MLTGNSSLFYKVVYLFISLWWSSSQASQLSLRFRPEQASSLDEGYVVFFWLKQPCMLRLRHFNSRLFSRTRISHQALPRNTARRVRSRRLMDKFCNMADFWNSQQRSYLPNECGCERKCLILIRTNAGAEGQKKGAERTVFFCCCFFFLTSMNHEVFQMNNAHWYLSFN